MSDKTTLLDETETAFKDLKRTLAGLDEALMREVWCGTWSTRDVVAHLSGWHREMSPALERLARGERPIPAGTSYDDVDAWNARFVAAKKDWTTDALLRELDASHRDFMTAAAAVPAERVVPDKTAWKLVDLNGRHHYQSHAVDIAAWRKSKGI
jgi:hypothetical protein